jgi:spermidine synthase
MIIFIPFGIITSIFQLVVLREFSFSIAKHELAFVLAAGFWIISCALGSLIKLPEKRLSSWLLPWACASFSVSICLIHLAKSLIGLQYFQTPNPAIVLLTLVLVGLPALIMGATFRWLLKRSLEELPPLAQNKLTKFFAFEAAGFFLGGVVFTFLLKDYTNPLFFSWLPLLLLPAIKGPLNKALSICLIALITVIASLNYNSIIEREFSGSRILINRGSRYGPIIVSTKSGVTNLFCGGSLLATSEDKSATEEFIHLSLSATDRGVNKDILFIGPPLSGQIEEITKYRLNSLDCLQINPLLWKFIPISSVNRNNKINLITDDPRAYLKETTRQYDAILMSMPAPSTLALNRYFTEDFFNLVARRLKPGGAFSFFMPSKREILSPQFVKFNSSIINALDRVFSARLIVPSDSMVIIASNTREISDQYLLNNFLAVKPKTDFFTVYHFQDDLDPQIRNYIQNKLDSEITPNSDFYPCGFLYYLALEQAKFHPNLKIELKQTQKAIIIFLLLCALTIIIGCRFPRTCCLLNIGSVGFTSISLSSIIFVLFQLYCAALFWKLGLLIALFMAGIVIGVYLMGNIARGGGSFLCWVYLGWMTASFTLLVNLKGVGAMNNAELVFYLYTLSCGILTGCAYPAQTQNLIKNKFTPQKVPGIIYAADLSGAFLGALTSGMLLIPFLGIPGSLLALISLNAIFALINLRR